MLFRLDFTQKTDGRLLVDAHASDPNRPNRGGHNSSAVLFANPDTFRALVDTAHLDEATAHGLLEAARVAESQPEMPTCCLQADLSEEQLDCLNMTPALELYGGKQDSSE